MAKAITQIEKRVPTRAEQDAQALGEIMSAVAQHKDALLVFMDVLGEMHQSGLLAVAQGLLKNRQQVGVIGVNQLNKSGAQRIIKNGVTAMQFMAQLDPDKLKQVLGAFARGLQEARPSEKPVGLWGMVNSFREPEVNASVSMMVNFLRGVGEGLPDAHPPS